MYQSAKLQVGRELFVAFNISHLLSQIIQIQIQFIYKIKNYGCKHLLNYDYLYMCHLHNVFL